MKNTQKKRNNSDIMRKKERMRERERERERYKVK